jgi:pimeloyl-ACP methyl ester carboxylesterase
LGQKRIDPAATPRVESREAAAAFNSGGKDMPKTLGWIVRALLVAGIALAAPLAHAIDFRPPKPKLNPIVFVHGGSGSGAQFESQAMRFTTNGYPESHIAVLEYDSSAIGTIMPEVLARLDALIDEMRTKTGAEQVDLMGHSLGTTVSFNYLATPEHAAKVAHYVNIDGRQATAPPGGVATLALWAGGVNRPTPPQIVGATNVTIPDQEHVQVATSKESFFEMFHFLRGRAPFTTRILPEIFPEITGRVANFPQNTGLDGAKLEVWWIDGRTGRRIFQFQTFDIGPDGTFGPFRVLFGLNFEFAVVRPGEVDINYFYEPFIRSDSLVRLNVAAGLAPFIATSENSTALTVVRFKEFWGDRGPQNDVLAINGTDVINPTTAPSGQVGTASVSFFLFDVGSDGVSNLTSVPFPFSVLPFLTAADLFIPSQPPGTLAVETVPRGDAAKKRVVNVRNIPSTVGRPVVQLNDFEP